MHSIDISLVSKIKCILDGLVLELKVEAGKEVRGSAQEDVSLDSRHPLLQMMDLLVR